MSTLQSLHWLREWGDSEERKWKGLRHIVDIEISFRSILMTKVEIVQIKNARMFKEGIESSYHSARYTVHGIFF